MKKQILIMAILPLLGSAGCEESDKYDSEEVVRLTVASVQPAAKEENFDHNYEGVWLPLYICKKDDDSQWRLWYAWGPIEGFDDLYEEGYEYVIDVYERHLTHSGPTGVPWRYRLKQLISRIEKDSEGVPERFLTP